MIAYIKGKLINLTPSTALILTDAGIGYECRISLETFSELKIIYDLPTSHTKICDVYTDSVFRTDAIPVMVCFYREVERKLFRNLMKIQGIGLNMALTIISAIGIDGLINFAESPSEYALLSIRGIGAKIAKQLVFDCEKITNGLNDEDVVFYKKVSLKQTSSTIQATIVYFTQHYYDAIEACKALGMSPKSAKDSVEKAYKDNNEATVQELIKSSLKS